MARDARFRDRDVETETTQNTDGGIGLLDYRLYHALFTSQTRQKYSHGKKLSSSRRLYTRAHCMELWSTLYV